MNSIRFLKFQISKHRIEKVNFKPNRVKILCAMSMAPSMLHDDSISTDFITPSVTAQPMLLEYGIFGVGAAI